MEVIDWTWRGIDKAFRLIRMVPADPGAQRPNSILIYIYTLSQRNNESVKLQHNGNSLLKMENGSLCYHKACTLLSRDCMA
jgi:hypothetical protein